ncbi:MAG: Rpn family recombination-promoting nuclease/putative transposase [Lachnospiraceae bacterium]|nr:Rpn family recombination-promoting nuclease/putative transposase [Lachnospiraceae bacterium]
MGQKDITTKDYMKENTVFADAFNKFIYKGEQVIKPENLKPLDTDITAIPYGADGAGVPTQRYRDVLKSATAMEDENGVYLLLGIESQVEVHHAMPVRNMVYDALQYAAQVEEAARSHREARKAGNPKELAKKPDSGEYLSGFYRADRLIPVVTLAVYFGAGEWDGPMSLHEMLSVQNPEILSYVSDYKLNLIAPEHMSDEEIDQFQTSLREVMLFIKHSKDRTKLNEMVQQDDRFKNMDRSAARVVSSVTGVEFKEDEEEEKVDMCQALKEMMEEANSEGMQAGMQKGALEKAKETAKRMINKGRFSYEEIAELTSLTVEEVQELALGIV